jgi:hypothetical protein
MTISSNTFQVGITIANGNTRGNGLAFQLANAAAQRFGAVSPAPTFLLCKRNAFVDQSAGRFSLRTTSR